MKNYTQMLSTLIARFFYRVDITQKDNFKSFRKKGFALFICMTTVMLLGMVHQIDAQIPYASSGSTYNQNFDNLYTTVPADNLVQAASLLPLGWSFVEGGANANTTFRNDNGSSGTGDTYLDGATASNERAFGSYASGSLNSQFGAVFINNTGSTLTQFTLSYTGEQWKDGGSGSAVLNTLAFAYAINASSLIVGTYVNVTALDFTARVNNTTSDVTLNGNLAANQRAISFTVTGISWAPGQTLFIRWTDPNDAGNDDNLAVDGLSFTAISSCTSPTASVLSGDASICNGSSTNLQVAITGGTSPFTVIYSDGTSNFTVNNYTTGSNIPVSPSSTKSYSLVSVTAAGGCVGSGNGGTPTVTVTNTVTPSISIGSNPSNTICAGTNVTFTATPTNGGAIPAYQWKLNGGNVGSNSDTYSNAALASSDIVTCVLTSNAACASPVSATSNALSITVNANVTPLVSISSNSGTTICLGTNVTFTATPTNGGTTPAYQWKLNGNDVGTNSDSYSNSTLIDQDVVTCVLTSNANCASPSNATSSSITITVTSTVLPAVSIAAGSATTICAGSSVTFTATPTNGGTTPAYQWKLNGTDVGTNSDTYVNSGLNDQDLVTCVMTSSNGCASPITATSNNLTITVNPNLTPSVSVIANPATPICSGTSVTFTATAVNGGTPSYQWTKNGINVGTNNSNYTDATLANGDLIACSITSTASCLTTTTATSTALAMSVSTAPTPSISGSLSFCTGGSTILDAGAGYTFYLWSTNETTQTINVSTSGTYSVLVSNGTCAGNSAPVNIVILTANQPGAFTTSSTSVAQGQNGVVYTVPNVAGNTYAWSYSGTGATINGTGNSITIDFSGSATDGTLSVTATNACGTSIATTIAVTVGFTAGKLVVEQIGDGTTLSGNSFIVKMLQFNTSGAGQQPSLIVSLPAAAIAPTNSPYNLVESGTSTSSGYISLSSDKSYVIMPGYNAAPGTASITSAAGIGRTIGKVLPNGTSQTNATYNSLTGNNYRSVVSDGNRYWLIGANGIVYSATGSTTGTTTTATSVFTTNGRIGVIFNNTLFVSTNSTSFNGTGSNLGIYQVGSFNSLPTTTVAPGTATNIINAPGGSAYGFAFSPNGLTCYVADDRNTGLGGIQKWTYSGAFSTTTGWSGGTWSLAYTLGTGVSNIGARGLTVDFAGANPIIYSTSAEVSGNRIFTITDSGINSVTSTLTTSGINLIYRGLCFSPEPLPCTSPLITSTTGTTPVCAGSTLNLGVVATGTSPLSYAWSGPNTFTSPAQNPSILNATTAASGLYTVTVTNACGTTTSSANAVVNSIPTATITPSGQTTFCAGGSVTLSATTADSYLWSDNSVNQDLNVTTSGTYTVTVTSNNCSATSAPVVVTVNPVLIPSVSISANPGSVICSGTSVDITASAVNGGVSPNYEFFLNGSSVQSGSSNVYTSASFNNNDEVTCTLTSNADCVSPLTANSSSITIVVSSSVVPSVSIAAGSSTTFCAGASITFTATPVNGGLTPAYQWLVNGNNAGSNSNTFTTSSLNDQDIVTVVMTSSNGCALPTTATSNSLTITVSPNVTPSVSVSATATTICTGTSVTFTATAVNGGTPSYQWTKNGNSVGTNNSTYTDAALLNGDVIVCSINSTASCLTTSAASSSPITVTVNAVPTPVISGSLTFCSGNLTALDAGAGYTSYLWSTGDISQGITVTAAGTYSVTVSNGTCNATSPSVTVTEISAPAQPAAFTTSSASVSAGTNGVVYTVPAVSGVTYNWNYTGAGATINGTSNSVTVDFSAAATNGTLSVTATNSCGTSTALSIAVTITAPVGVMRITEFMYNGGGAGGAGEFVEFTNVSTIAVDMSGWSFDDNSRLPGSQSLTAFGIVQPGESVILTELPAATFRTNWNLCNGVKVIGGSTNNLGREDEVNLYDAFGTLVDRITYGDVTFALGSIRTTLKSGWVNAVGLGTNTISNWTLSAVADVENSFTSSLGEIGNPGISNRATIAYNPCVVVVGAPTIVMDVASTTNYLDGGVAISPNSPYGVSGVINDLTDPADSLGIDFVIGDPNVPVANLTVSVTSSNTAVVPLANLVLTGTNASRNLKITPAAVGYAVITVTVNNGTSNTSYILNYAASDPSPNLTPVTTVWHTGMSDGSDGIAIDNDFYISGDDELNVLNVYSRVNSGLPFVSYNYTANLALPDPAKPEVDVEASTRSLNNSNKVYWTGSMSNGKLPYDNKPNRDRLFATTVTGTGAATSFAFSGYVNIRTALLAWGDANGYAFTASSLPGVDSKAINGFSLEGLTFGPDGTTLFLGLRAPLVPTSFRHNAVIAPLLNFEAWFNNGNPVGPPTFGAPIELDLDFRGIRDITRLSNGSYIIVAGSPIDNGGINNIYKWSGYSSDAPVIVQNSAGGVLNIEGLMQVNIAGTNQPDFTKLQIITDYGANILYQDNSEAKDLGDLNLRKFRSDVLTGLDLDICSGFSASISVVGDTIICAGGSVTLSANAGVNNTYVWSSGQNTQTITTSAFQTYNVTVTSSTTGCSALSSPISVSKKMPSDINNDGITDNSDFLMLLGQFGFTCNGCPTDLNKDGITNNVDFLILLGKFGLMCN